MTTHICSKALTCKSETCSHAKPHDAFHPHPNHPCNTAAPCGQWPGDKGFKPSVICLTLEKAAARDEKNKPPALDQFEATQYRPKIPADQFTVIEKVGANSWAVRDGFGACLSNKLEWVDEPMPSARTPEFLAEHRFQTAEAAAEAFYESIGKSRPA